MLPTELADKRNLYRKDAPAKLLNLCLGRVRRSAEAASRCRQARGRRPAVPEVGLPEPQAKDYLAKITVEKRLPYWREAIEFSEPQLLVATDGDEIVGFVGFDRSRDAGTNSTVGEIWALYVLPAHWGKGAGLALWDGAREGLKEEGCTQVTLWVLLRNERALRFYEQAAGFKREMPSLKTVAFGSAKLEEIRLKRAVD